MGVQIHEDRFGVITAALAPEALTASTTEEQDFTVPGLTTDMFVVVNKPTHDAGVGIGNARVKAADTLSITFVNATSGTPTPTSETYKIYWFKPENTVSGRVNP